MENQNLKIITLIHDITQLGYYVQFCGDFKSMVRIEFTEEFGDDFYKHDHLSIPDGGIERLENEVVKALTKFLEEHKENEHETK